MLKKLALFAALTFVLSPAAPVFADCGMSHDKSGSAKAECPMGDMGEKKCVMKTSSDSCSADPNGRVRHRCRASGAKTNFVPGNKKH